MDIRATAFQRRVWTYLQSIPFGATRSYSQVAKAIGQPTASRAVARACATNPVAVAIPCHRVVREDGSISGYRWGVERKKALLEMEQRECDGIRRSIRLRVHGRQDYDSFPQLRHFGGAACFRLRSSASQASALSAETCKPVVW